MTGFFPSFELTDAQIVMGLSLDEKVERGIALLRLHEPPEGYYLAFSGGKDSVVCKELLRMSGVKFEARYNNTTIDAPELVRYIKKYHPEIEWNEPKRGNMFHRIATAPKVPPTRQGRWCCEEYKEYGGADRVKVMGVRAQESDTRTRIWREVASDKNGDVVICAIVFWTVEDVWNFIRSNNLPYCSLYDEGFDRLGCVGCPLASLSKQQKEFKRWPNYERNWKRAIIANWQKWKDVPNTKTGQPRYQAKFKTGEEFWQWWLTAKRGPQTCQEGLLWTNTEE